MIILITTLLFLIMIFFIVRSERNFKKRFPETKRNIKDYTTIEKVYNFTTKEFEVVEKIDFERYKEDIIWDLESNFGL